MYLRTWWLLLRDTSHKWFAKLGVHHLLGTSFLESAWVARRRNVLLAPARNEQLGISGIKANIVTYSYHTHYNHKSQVHATASRTKYFILNKKNLSRINHVQIGVRPSSFGPFKESQGCCNGPRPGAPFLKSSVVLDATLSDTSPGGYATIGKCQAAISTLINICKTWHLKSSQVDSGGLFFGNLGTRAWPSHPIRSQMEAGQRSRDPKNKNPVRANLLWN